MELRLEAKLLAAGAWLDFNLYTQSVKASKQGCNVVLRGRRGTSGRSNMFHDVSKGVLCGRRNTFARFSEDALHFTWQAQHFGDLRCQSMPFCFAGATLLRAGPLL